MAYRLLALLPLLLGSVSAEGMGNMSMAETMTLDQPVNDNPPVTPVVQQQAPATPAAIPYAITHAQANAVVQAAVAKAVEIKMPSNFAVADPSGHLVSFLRMDGAMLVSAEVAQKKAKTVSMFGGKYRTGDLYNATSPGGSLYGIQATNNGLIFFGGGVPLKINGSFVGALGVSGGTVEQDQTIANAAAQSLK